MSEFNKAIGVASAVAVVAALGIAVLAISAFPDRGTLSPATQSDIKQTTGGVTTSSSAVSTLTQTQIAVTRTASGGFVIHQSRTQLACPSGAAGTSRCLYFDGWAANYTARTISLLLGYSGSGPIVPTTVDITFTGSQGNRGFTGLVSMTSVSLPASDSEETVTSPILSNLQNGDQLTISVRGTAGMYFSTILTISI